MGLTKDYSLLFSGSLIFWWFLNFLVVPAQEQKKVYSLFFQTHSFSNIFEH